MALESVKTNDVEVLSIADPSPITNWFDTEWSDTGADVGVRVAGASLAQAAHGLDGVLEVLFRDECSRIDADGSAGVVYDPLPASLRGSLRFAAQALLGQVLNDLERLHQQIQRSTSEAQHG
jgi:hypothetical protein